MSKKYLNVGQQRILRVMMLLFNDPINGIAPVQIARELGIPQAQVTRDLANLMYEHLAERDEVLQTWRLTPKLPQQNFKLMAALDRAERRIEETRNRLTRTPD